MIKFDYDRVILEVKYTAKEEGVSVRRFLKAFDADFSQFLKNENCLTLSLLFNKAPTKDAKLLKHVRGCNFCRRFTKLMVMIYLNPDERKKLFEDIFPDTTQRPDFDNCISVLDPNDPDDCYGLMHFLFFNSLNDEVKKHHLTCKRCGDIVDFFKKMPMPELG